ncbi:hypothetical protein J6590_045126 [Homalodisca vitripennis]|nr:hypothetical protein J6590_045126 [Homalodisca vitripennis]
MEEGRSLDEWSDYERSSSSALGRLRICSGEGLHRKNQALMWSHCEEEEIHLALHINAVGSDGLGHEEGVICVEGNGHLGRETSVVYVPQK